jgi:4-amino-4-deoxy-L-arabinose transferase-like glycosyltransferase
VRRPLFLLLLATFALKVAVLAQFNAHPLLQPAGDMDSGVYARLAVDVARGDLLLRGPGPVPFFVSPLYIYFLAAIHALSAGSLLAAKVIQIALGTAAVGLVWGMTRRLFDDRAALVSGILYALTGVVSFHEILILQAALDPFLTALSLFLLADALTPGRVSLRVNKEGARAAVSSRWGAWAAAGVAFGLLALNRPNALLCVAAIAVVLAFERVRPAVALLAGTAAIVALPLARNLIVSGEPVLISSHGGLNFLVGNGPGANGVYRALPGITPDIGGQARDAKKVAEAAEDRTLSSREVSIHFAREALRWIAESPAAAGSLFLRKLQYVLSGDEAPLNFSFPWYRSGSLALRLLAVGPGLLVPLAGAGLILALFAAAGADRRALLVWAAFIPAYVLAVAAFFVATRYRLPLLVALAPLAGCAVTRLGAAWRVKGRPLALAAGTAAVLAAVSLWPTGLYDGGADEDMHWALYLVEKGDAAEAVRTAEAAASRHPDPGLMWFRMGQAWAAARRMDDAIAALEKAAALQPHPPATQRALAAAHESRGVDRVLAHDALAAQPDLERAVALSPDDAGMVLNLAAVLAEKGDRDRARDLAQRALALRPGYEKAEALLWALK